MQGKRDDNRKLSSDYKGPLLTQDKNRSIKILWDRMNE